MQLRKKYTEGESLEAPLSPKIMPKNKRVLTDLVGNTISLKVLEYLEEHMQPHHQHFNIVDIASILEGFAERELEVPGVGKNKVAEEDLTSTVIPIFKVQKRVQETGGTFQIKKDEALQALMDQLRTVFVYWGRTTLSYEYINEYIYNQQLRSINTPAIDEDYMDIGQKRVRIDENLKLCIMPLGMSGGGDQQSRTRDVVFRQNLVGSQLEGVYTVAREGIRGVHIRPELIGIAGDYDRKGSSPGSCWYRYQEQCIAPKKSTISAHYQEKQLKKEKPLTLIEAKQLKNSNKVVDNISQMVTSTSLLILKAQASKSVMAIITVDQSFLVQPLKNDSNQGYVGNLLRDIPPVVAYPGPKQLYQQILLLHGYNDSLWLILTQKFIYLYQIPQPSQNIVLLQQNNSKEAANKKNPLLLMCQRLPAGTIKAKVLGKRHLALMLQANSIIVIELFVHNRGLLEGRPLSPEDNYYKITNKIYNDIQFKAICYNPKDNYLFLSDFGAYLIRLSFSPAHGDIEEEGPTYDKQQNMELNVQMWQNSYMELHASRSKLDVRANSPIKEEDEQASNCQSYIQVHYLKGYKEKQYKHLLSLYKKQNKSPQTIIIKHQTRQIITLLACSPHYNTLITYEAQSFEKKALGKLQGEAYREWGNNNTIKLWDARHMTIYQTLKVTIEASLLELRANGLFFLTAEKGYLGFYQFNQDKRAMVDRAEQRVLDKQNLEVVHELSEEVHFQQGTLYFASQVSTYNKFNHVRTHRTHLTSFALQHYPESQHLQTLPSEITALAVRSRIYVLENSRQGVQSCQLHIYNRLGLKEQMLIFSNHEDIDVTTGKVRTQNYNQQFKHIRKITHSQFEVALWNSDCLKLIGDSKQESLTVVFGQHGKGYKDVQMRNQIKMVEISGTKILIYYDHIVKSRETVRELPRERKNSFRQQEGQDVSIDKKKKSNTRLVENVFTNIAILSCQNDRLIYKIQRISANIKVLHSYNSILLTKQTDPLNDNYDLIRVLDIAETGPLISKYLFSAKLAKATTQQITMKELQEMKGQIIGMDPTKNEILQSIRQFTLKKHIGLEESKISVSNSNQLLLTLVLRIQTQLWAALGNQPLKVDVEFMLYTRNLTNELVNRDYKVSRLQIGVKTKKNIKEYQTSSTRTENISDNKQISFQALSSSSNYGELNMSILCQMIQQQGSLIPTPDLTPLVLNPSLITDDYKEAYHSLSLKQEAVLMRLFPDKMNKMAVLSTSALRVVDFDEDKLTGVMVLTNKVLRTMSVFNISFDCKRASEELPYRVKIQIEKVGILEATKPQSNTLHSSTVNILQWNYDYKSEVDRMWDQTLLNIKQFLKQEKIDRARSKSPKKTARHQIIEPQTEPTMSRLTLDFKQLPALKIRKAQNLKRKLQHSDRQRTEPSPRPIDSAAEEAQNISKMFKKWSINQNIAREKLQANNKAHEFRHTNRDIKKLLYSEKDKAERIEQLIEASQKIKEVSRSPNKSQRYREGNISPSRFKQLQNVIKASQIANNATLKCYLQQRKKDSSNCLSIMQQLTRQDSYNSNSETNRGTPLDTEINDIRTTNLSKLSMYSNKTKLTNIRVNKEESSEKKEFVDPNSLEGKITHKLEQMLVDTVQSKKTKVSIVSPLQSPSRRQNDSRRDMLKSRMMSSKAEYELIRQTDKSRLDGTTNAKSRLGSSLTMLPIQTPFNQAASPQAITKRKHTQRYKTEETPAQERQTSPKRLNTIQQDRLTERTAIESMKKSEIMLKDFVLPEIQTNKQKLILKMKEKKSFIKVVNHHLEETNLSTLRNGQQRKRLVSILSEYK